MKTFDCACGAHLEADADDDLLAVMKQHAAEQHGGDPAFSDMELDAQIERSALEEEDRGSVEGRERARSISGLRTDGG